MNEIDPELHQMWLEARERHLGHVSAYSFDLTADPPGVSTASAASSSSGGNKAIEFVKS